MISACGDIFQASKPSFFEKKDQKAFAASAALRWGYVLRAFVLAGLYWRLMRFCCFARWLLRSGVWERSPGQVFDLSIKIFDHQSVEQLLCELGFKGGRVLAVVHGWADTHRDRLVMAADAGAVAKVFCFFFTKKKAFLRLAACA